MRKYLLVAVALSLLIPTPVLAEDRSPTPRRPDRTPLIQENRQEIREQVQTRLQEFRSNVAGNHANRLEHRFTFYHTRLTSIITRFQTRLDALKSEGKDVSVSQSHLDTAKTKLSEAKAKGEQAIAAFKAIDPAKFSEQKEAAFAARDLAKQSRQLFQECHQSLRKALVALKEVK